MTDLLSLLRARLRTAMADLADDSGQATAEYVLVMLGAAAIALLVVAWATRSNVVGTLLDAVFDSMISKIT